MGVKRLFFSWKELTRSILERPYDPLDRSIDVHIYQLRRRIGHVKNEKELIKTVHGTSYCLVCSSSSSASLPEFPFDVQKAADNPTVRTQIELCRGS